jgi:hypothetical protein
MAISADSPQSEGFSGLLPAGYWKSKGICIPNYPECANFPIITTGDFAGLGTNGPNGSDRLVFELHEDMTKIKGFTLSSGVTLTATATTTASDLRRFCWKR